MNAFLFSCCTVARYAISSWFVAHVKVMTDSLRSSPMGLDDGGSHGYDGGYNYAGKLSGEGMNPAQPYRYFSLFRSVLIIMSRKTNQPFNTVFNSAIIFLS